MRVLLSTYGSRGDAQPLAGLAARSRAPGVRARVCAPADAKSARLLAGAGAESASAADPVRTAATSAASPAPVTLSRRPAAMLAPHSGSLPKGAHRAGACSSGAAGSTWATCRAVWGDLVADRGVGAAAGGPAPVSGSRSVGLAAETRARARARDLADTVRTDGVTRAAELLLDIIDRDGPPVSV